MTSSLVFNHNSLPFDSVIDADVALPDFLKICLRANRHGFSTILIDESIDKNWFRIKLADSYFWQDWYHKSQRNENRDVITAFRAIATRQPFYDERDMEDGTELFEVVFKGHSDISALQAAAWHDAPLVSFPTRPPWTSSPLSIEIRTLDADSAVVTLCKDLLNFYSYANSSVEFDRLAEQKRASIASGTALLDNCQNLYPNIILCGKAVEQLRMWSAGATILNQVKESLKSLDLFCEKCEAGAYHEFRLDALREVGLNHQVSGESEHVKSSPALRGMREFYLPTGHKVLFENHIKLAMGYRIHFFPDQSLKNIYVGYIGPHLKLK